ncbi:hypothetical protein FOA52_010675 [Chlamydomonas sp. UWO 241]|nr:hypothetical protein FOA52_010675 [Chlamydomonas sp. UWO 241]
MGVSLTDPQTKRARYVGCYATEEDAARAYDRAAVQAHGPGAKRNVPGETMSEPPERMQRGSSRFHGVSWLKTSSAWKVQLKDPQTKRVRHIGSFASEEDAARAYDCAAVQACGPGAKRNFPGEAISKPPVSKGEERLQSSSYIGVSWDKSSSSLHVKLYEPSTKRQRHIGSFSSEGDAARAHDVAAVQAHGPGAKRNFPGETVGELPMPVGKEQKQQRGSSRYLGVTWHKGKFSWNVALADPQTKRARYVGCYATEEDAARAYDRAAVQARGPGAKRNFPDEAIIDLPVAVGEEQKQHRGSSRYLGVTWNKRTSKWGTRSCGTHRRSAFSKLGALPPRRTQPGRTTARL